MRYGHTQGTVTNFVRHHCYASRKAGYKLQCPTLSLKSQDSPLCGQDRDVDSGKTRGGGICAYINDLWCRSHSVKYKICDPNVEILGMTLRPFYLPREFGCIPLFVVYAPPSGKASQAASTIANCVHELQLSHPDAPAIVVGDLNQCHLETVLPGFEQYVKDQTRKDNILDKCFCKR